MKNVMTLVLGGGRGTRLYPLTQFRSKPAVPVAGKYRLIDIPLSNCVNSGINRIYTLTQFNSVSLHRHIRRTYAFDVFDNGFVEILAAQQTLASSDWYQGTADAVRQNLRYIQQPDIDYVLVLSGDQLYRMDFREMLKTHQQAEADVTISAVPVPSKDASALGIMRLDDNGKVEGFIEKPETEEDLNGFRTDPAWIDKHGIESRGRDCLASMGIYLFNRDVLVDVLDKTSYHDFGKEIFPASIRARHVQVHLFDGYWEDIGTIKSFYEANLELASKNPPFDLMSAEAPLYSRARFLPPTRIDDATVRNSLIADGCIIEESAVIENSVIGLRCRIGSGVVIRDSIIMGNDSYQTFDDFEYDSKNGRPPLGIGSGTIISRAIVDKDCRIGRNVRIENANDVDSTEEENQVMIKDGIVVVSKNAVLPDGWTM
ncbi:MAG: glucose-1-phosphate adenylyltransferase [Pirellulales bacterium]|nr:glucose-1-phosphate adenylyltransferase [Pirellulales bacterium]